MKISIITVCYNSSKTIEKTFQSIKNQSYQNIEYIVVDGASSDDTLKIIKNYNSCISKYISESDKGLYDAMNKGIALATGDIIGILNSDDIFHSNNIIQELTNIISKNKSCGVFLGNVAYFDNLDYYKITRFYSSSNFKTWKMKFGLILL